MSALQLDLLAPKWNPETLVPNLATPRSQPVDPFLERYRSLVDTAGDDLLKFDEKTWDHKSKATLGVDVEVYPNFAVFCFINLKDGKRVAFEKSERCELNYKAVAYLMRNYETISFNGLAYDSIIIALAINRASNRQLKEASDKIIFGNYKPWEIEKVLGIKVPKFNHIDVNGPNPSIQQSLKIVGARLNYEYLVDLPFPPETLLTPKQMNLVTLYCFNDIEATIRIYQALREPLKLREEFGKIHRKDLRSKSDSQVGEIIVKSLVEKITGRRLERASGQVDPVFGCIMPPFLEFCDPQPKALLESLKTATFCVTGAEKIKAPPFLENLKITLGKMTYSVGIGGLHSTEARRALRSDDNNFLLDVDVASQYPNIIMKLGLYPPALGPTFLKVYGDLIKERLAAKDSGDKTRADGGRIALNGVYGKLGSPYSVLYAPHLLIAVTLTGQLAVLMLIERAEAAGIPVVSANTDGVVFFCPRAKADELNAILEEWQERTGFKVDRTPYRALYNASVNTYIAVKEDGKVKRKGYIADPWEEGDLRGQMSKNPQMQVCSRAIVRYIIEGTPIEDTIRNCTDPRAFVTVIKVTGGGVWRGHPLGRAVRYFWSLDGDPVYADNGKRKVAKTEGAKPLLELTDALPPDLDYLRYCLETVKIANDLGITL